MFAERLNRITTFVAAAISRMPVAKQNMQRVTAGDAWAKFSIGGRKWNERSFAEWVVDESQYRMGKVNRPKLSRGVGSPLLQLKGYMMQTQAGYRMASMHGPRGKASFLAAIAMMLMLGGLWGPGAGGSARHHRGSSTRWPPAKTFDLETETRRIAAEMTAAPPSAPVAKGVPCDDRRRYVACRHGQHHPGFALQVFRYPRRHGHRPPDACRRARCRRQRTTAP